MDVALEVGALTETVTVAVGSTELLQTDKADTHTEIKSADDHAAAAAAEPQLPVADQPGAGRDAGASCRTAKWTRRVARSRTNVNGLDRNNNGTKTDGATNVNIWLPHHTMLRLARRDHRHGERQHQQLRRRAGHGRRRGHHGHHQVRHERAARARRSRSTTTRSLNAKPYFATEKQAASAHIDGVTLGGPIMKNKLFFFGAWEGQYQKTPSAVLQRAAGGAARRRLQPGVQPATARCRSSTTRAPAIPTARAACRSPATSSRRTDRSRSRRRFRRCIPLRTSPGRRRRATSAERMSSRNYVQRRRPEVRSEQLRLQGQLEPVVRGAGLGQVLAHGGQRQVAAGATSATTRRADRRHDGQHVHVRDHVDAQSDDGLRRHVRHLEDDPRVASQATSASATTASTRSGSRHERRRQLQQRPAIRRHARRSLTAASDTIGNADGWDPVQRDERTYALAAT